MDEQISEQTKDTLHYLDGILYKYPTMEFLRKAVTLIRAQAEEIERLRRDKGRLMEVSDNQGRRIANSELEISALKEQIERLKAQRKPTHAEDDPLKVGATDNDPLLLCALAQKHNAFVDEVRNRIANLELTLEREPNFYNAYAESIELHTERIIALEQRIESNDRGVAGAFDDVYAKIKALEQQLRAHLGKEAE